MKLDFATVAQGVGIAAAAFVAALLKRKRPPKRPNLLRHPFFSRIRETMRTSLNLPIQDPMRREAIQDLLRIKFQAWSLETERLVGLTDWAELEPSQFRDALLAFIDRVVASYEREAEDRGIPHPIILKFRIWHEPAVAQTLTYIDTVSDSDWLGDNHLRLVSFLSSGCWACWSIRSWTRRQR